MTSTNNNFSDLAQVHEVAWYRLNFLCGVFLLIHAVAYLPVLLAVGLGSMPWYSLVWPIIGLALPVAVKVSLESRSTDDDLRFLKFMACGTFSATLLSVIAGAACRLASGGWHHLTFESMAADAFLYAMVFGMLFMLMGPLELLIPMRPFSQDDSQLIT